VSLEPLPGEPVAHPLRAPAAPLLLAAGMGIAWDRSQDPPAAVWWGVLIAGTLVPLLFRRDVSRATVGLLLSWGAVFGLWHHAWWSDPPADHIFHRSTPNGELVTAVGHVTEPSWIRQRPGETPQTIWTFDCAGVLDEGQQLVASAGRLRVQCADVDLATQPGVFQAGDQLTLVGRLVRPAPAGNPGGFDYRNWLRTQGVEALLRVQTRASIEQAPAAASLSDQFTNWRFRLRLAAVRELQTSTDATTAAVAEALLLGTRSQLPEDVRQAFIASGMLHVLAISGVNVAVIWWGLIRLFRTLGVSLRTSGCWVIAGLLVYGWLTDANPPIVRAVTFAVVLQLAELSGRRVSALQGMSLAALVVLARNPTDLFNPGAWLSFLSVAVLAAANRRTLVWLAGREPADDSDDTPADRAIWWEASRRWFWQANAATGGVWLASAPLVANQFHLVSFAGIVLNLLLGPGLMLLLWLGYAWLVSLAVSPLLSQPLLWMFASLLQGLLLATSWAGQWAWGHAYFIGPPGWWVAGFYAGLGLVLLRPEWCAWRMTGRLLLVWLNLGLAAGLLPQRPPGLVCDVLSVGHGLAIVVQGPDGRTLVYDAGSLAGGHIAAEAVAQTLWQSGQSRLDALIVSHADVDHCNGVPILAERLQPGMLLTHPSFVSSDKPVVNEVQSAWRSAGGISELLGGGDELDWDSSVAIEVWQPDHATRYERENANSLIVLVTYAGRRLLLTGDLEREGLAEFLQRPRSPVDVVIAPHHGSRLANPPEFGAWTHPGWVAISTAEFGATEQLRDCYPPDTVLLNTATVGRIRCLIDPVGTLQFQTFREPELF